MDDAQTPRLSSPRRQHCGILHLSSSHLKEIPLRSRQPRDNLSLPVHRHADVHGLNRVEHGSRKGGTQDWTEERQRGGARRGSAPLDDCTAPAPSELISVTPRREFRAQRLANTNELETFAQTRQADLVGGDAQFGPAIRALTLLDCFPPLLDRSEVPSLAFPADYPQPSLCSIERESPTNGEMLDRLVCTEVGFAEETGRIHLPLIQRQHSRTASAVALHHWWVLED